MDTETEILERDYTEHMTDWLLKKRVRISSDHAEVENMNIVAAGGYHKFKDIAFAVALNHLMDKISDGSVVSSKYGVVYDQESATRERTHVAFAFAYCSEE
jgi:hypothetical protein